MKIKYVHTIKGKLAGLNGNQICYASKPRKNGWHPKAVNSLKKIKIQQEKSKEYRKMKDFSDTDYGYQIIEVWNKKRKA